jgi:hypothetical protein
MSLKTKGDFLIHRVVLQIRVSGAAGRPARDVSRETFLRKTARFFSGATS